MASRPNDDLDDYPLSENLWHLAANEPQPLPPREVVDEEAEVHRLRCPLCGGRIYAWPNQGERCERCGQEPRQVVQKVAEPLTEIALAYLLEDES